jgi:hypothetical protein
MLAGMYSCAIPPGPSKYTPSFERLPLELSGCNIFLGIKVIIDDKLADRTS